MQIRFKLVLLLCIWKKSLLPGRFFQPLPEMLREPTLIQELHLLCNGLSEVADSGFTHSNSSSSQNITLDSAGKYLVFINLPISGNGQGFTGNSTNIGGVQVSGGFASQGYIRNADRHPSLLFIGLNGRDIVRKPSSYFRCQTERCCWNNYRTI